MNKIVINVRDGLGNQCFCYAFGYALAKKKKCKLILDSSRLDTNKIKERRFELLNFNIEYDKRISYKYIFNPKLRKWGIDRLLRIPNIGLFTKVYQEEDSYTYDCNVYKIRHNTYFDGYWQSYLYFDEFRDDLVKMFSMNRVMTRSMENILREVSECYSVALHVRRGDYLTINWSIPMEYYDKALLWLREQTTEKLKVYVFTDDRVFAKEYFEKVKMDNVEFAFLNYESDNYTVDDFYIMSKCKNNIIANSSYSWWAAYLNANKERIVICPNYSKWGKTFYPSDWNCIDVE